MPTKTEYREYIQSEAWQKRRKKFLGVHEWCNRCDLPRWLAVIAYDQDLHVHHKNYARVGGELDEDLEPLCKRCHEIETWGNTALHEVKHKSCVVCGANAYDMKYSYCISCMGILNLIVNGPDVNQFTNSVLCPPNGIVWEWLLDWIRLTVGDDEAVIDYILMTDELHPCTPHKSVSDPGRQ